MASATLAKTEEAAKLLSNVLVCAQCKQRSDELQFLGTVCKHAFCWSCINVFNKNRQLCCSLCNSMIELTNASPAHIVNNVLEEMDRFYKLLAKYRDLVGSQGCPSPSKTQKIATKLKAITNEDRRNVDDFLFSTQKEIIYEEFEEPPNKILRKNNVERSAESDHPTFSEKIVIDTNTNCAAENNQENRDPKADTTLFHFAPLAASTQKQEFLGTPLGRKYIFDRAKGYKQEPIMFSTQAAESHGFSQPNDMGNVKVPVPRPTRSFEFTKNITNTFAKDSRPAQKILEPDRPSTPITPQTRVIVEPLPETLERKAQRKSLTYRKSKYDLISAVMEGNYDLVSELLTEGYDANECNEAQCTPLYFAAQLGHYDICKLLVEAGALINAACDRICDTALHVAVKNQHSEIAEYLLSKGASKAARNLYNKLPWEMSDYNSPVRKLVERYAGRPMQPKILAKLPDVFVVYIHANENLEGLRVYEKFKEFAKCEDNLTADVTHMVALPKYGCCEADITFIQAMLRGLTIVTVDWVLDCFAQGQLIRDTTKYEVEMIKFRDLDVVYNSCKRYRLDKQQLKPRLFQGCIFYVAANRLKSYGTRIFIQNIIKMAGGDIVTKEPKVNKEDPPPYYKQELKTPYFILYETDTKLSERILTSSKLHKVSPLWLFDCLAKHDFLDPY